MLLPPFKKTWLIVACVAGLAALFASVLVAANVYRYFFPYLDQSVSGPITLSSQWTELVPGTPLSVNRQIQIVVLDLDKSIKFQRDGFELILPDGSTVTPEVRLVDVEGNVYPLTQPSAWFSPLTGVKYREFSSKNDLPKNKLFRAVRVRCDKPIFCNRIFWRCYNMWDVS
jgi:hypothetical protein